MARPVEATRVKDMLINDDVFSMQAGGCNHYRSDVAECLDGLLYVRWVLSFSDWGRYKGYFYSSL